MIVDTDFADHWKTRMLVDALNDEAGPVYVIRLWAHCQTRRQWQFENLSTSALKAICRFPGDADVFESAMLASKFIVREEDVLTVHEWEVYNASLISAWNNGRLGGRPSQKKPLPKPTGNPSETHGFPAGNPVGIRGEETREDESSGDRRREEHEEPPAPLKGGTSENNKSPKFRAEDFPIPESLRTPAFLDAWSQWISYRTSKRQPLSQMAVSKQMHKLMEKGPAAAVTAIHFSIANDYQGIFLERSGTNAKPMSFAGTRAFLEQGEPT